MTSYRQGIRTTIAAVLRACKKLLYPMTITPEQCRAARALLDISQDALAAKSGVSLRAIANFERGKTVPMRANLVVIRQALEQLGVEFTDGGWMRLKQMEEKK